MQRRSIVTGNSKIMFQDIISELEERSDIIKSRYFKAYDSVQVPQHGLGLLHVKNKAKKPLKIVHLSKDKNNVFPLWLKLCLFGWLITLHLSQSDQFSILIKKKCE